MTKKISGSDRNNNITFVLIHGWGGSTDSLEELGENLPGKTVRIELPGFGKTPIEQVFDLEKYGKYVLEKMSILKPSNDIIYVGHSVGGKILLRLASRGKLGKNAPIVLINSSGIKPRNSLKKKVFGMITAIYRPLKALLYRVGLGDLQEFLQKAFYKFIVGARDYEKLNHKPILKKTFQNIIEEHIVETDLRDIPNPTLVIWGQNDTVTPLWMGELIAKNIPNAELKVHTDASHSLPLKYPKECSDMIVEFLLKLGVIND